MYLGAKLALALVVAMLATGPMWAGDKTSHKKNDNALVIKGKVVEDGKPQMAEIRVKSLDRKMPDRVVLTDSRGKFIVLGLQPGSYTITAHEEGTGYARSRATIKVERKGWANINFDLGLDKDLGNDASRISGHDHIHSASSHMAPNPLPR